MNADIWQNARRALGDEMLSVILPAYNLSAKIEENLLAVAALLDRSGLDYELVPVDDGSKDGTADAIASVEMARADVIHPVYQSVNAGKGEALKAGFAHSKGAFILLLDGDLDILPTCLPGFFDSMVENGSDIVVGSKRHPKSEVQYPWHRRLASFIYFSIVRLTLSLPVTDTQTGMKLFKRKILGESLARMLVKTYAFDLELLSIAVERGARISEAPVKIVFGEKLGALKPRTVKQMAKDSLAVFYRLRLLHYYAKVEVPPPATHDAFVSVVIACPEPSDYLYECLAALVKQTYRHFEVIVLPDAQCDLDEYARAFGEVRLIVEPTGKVRPADKRNRGIELAKGEIVAFIDDDAYPEAHWLECAVKYFTDDAIGALGGPGVTPPNDSYLAKLGGRVYENVFVSGNYRYRYVGGRVRLDVDDYPSCNLFVRTDVLRKIGGYRTDFWPGEDTLLCEDIVMREKKRLVYDPWTIVYHHRRKLFAPHLRQLTRYAMHRGYFAKRHPKTSLRLSYFIPSVFAVGIVLGLVWSGLWFGGVWAMCPSAIVRKMGFAGTAAFLGGMSVYAVLVGVTTFARNPITWFLTFAGVFASHFGYGVKFIVGLCSSKMPCEYIGKDHAVK